MPAQPSGGAVWSGTFKERPQISVNRSSALIHGNDSDEPQVLVSLNVAMSVMIARRDWMNANEPKRTEDDEA